MPNRQPTFILAGAAKAGTTALHRFLDAHPDVFLSPIKEPNFFARDIDPESFAPQIRELLVHDIEGYLSARPRPPAHVAFVREWDQYLRLFDGGRDRAARGEASPTYLWSRVAAQEIAARLPDAKVLILLRHPIERAFSHYRMDVGLGIQRLPFRKAVERDMAANPKGWGVSHLYVELGMYSEQIARFQRAIRPENLKIGIYRDFDRDPAGFLRDVYAFLGVDPEFRPPLEERHNEARNPRSASLLYWLKRSGVQRAAKRILPQSARAAARKVLFRERGSVVLSPRDRAWLIEIFRDDVEKVQRMLNRDLGFWLEMPKAE